MMASEMVANRIICVISKTRRHRAGFTTIEIMTVVVIMGILAAIALPNLGTQDDLIASSAARIVVSDLLYAQSLAIATGQTQSVSFTVASTLPGGTNGSYSLTGPGGIAVKNPVTQDASYIRSFGTDVSGPLADVAIGGVQLDSASNTVLSFNSLGQPLACATNGTPAALSSIGIIELQCGARIVTIYIEPDTGEITVSNP